MVHSTRSQIVIISAKLVNTIQLAVHRSPTVKIVSPVK